MALLRSITRIPTTFKELARKVLGILVNMDNNENTSRIDFVCDQYIIPSIKDSERERRGRTGSVRVQIGSAYQKCPKQWNRYLQSGENKNELIEFLHGEWTSQGYVHFLQGKQLYTTCGSLCYRLQVVDGTVEDIIVPEVQSPHEEADVCMFLHAKHAAGQGHNDIAIHSSDTDVLVLAMFYQVQIQPRNPGHFWNKGAMKCLGHQEIIWPLGD